MTVLLFLLACSSDPASSPPAREVPDAQSIRVEVVEISPSDAVLSLELPGEVTGAKDALLAAANGGFVERVLVSEGDVVSANQVLARIDAGLYSAQLEAADAQLEQAQAVLRRLKALGDLGAASQAEDAATGVRVAKANRAQASNRLARAVVRAPFSGVVAQINIERGEAVGPGMPILRLVQIHPAKVTLSVSDRDVVGLVKGTLVKVSTRAQSDWMGGEIAHISPAADLNTRAFPVEVLVDNPTGKLLPGMIASVAVERVLAENAIVIPQDWLITRKQDRGVFVEEQSKAVFKPVVLGAVVRDRVEIVSGVEAGDRIVITGHRDLVAGDSLVVARHGTCCEAGRPVWSE